MLCCYWWCNDERSSSSNVKCSIPAHSMPPESSTLIKARAYKLWKQHMKTKKKGIHQRLFDVMYLDDTMQSIYYLIKV